tara:strand:- start:155 stop:1231 length:1077 start_codon:yes stop_codon:yes gene_type:complete
MTNSSYFVGEVLFPTEDTSCVLDKHGNAIPFHDFTAETVDGFPRIAASPLPYSIFRNLVEVFCQRDTESRWDRKKKELQTLLLEHIIVFTGVLTRDDTYQGKSYPKGTLFRLDSNTRAFNWEKGNVDFLPQNLLCIQFAFESLERIKESYDTFDSITSTEKNQEKFYGILNGIYNYDPLSSKVKKGTILTGLNFAANCAFPDIYKNVAPSAADLVGQTGAFLNEIKTFDTFIKREKSWNQAWIAGAMLSMKRYGCDNVKLLKAFKLLDKQSMNTEDDARSGTTWIVQEWTRVDQDQGYCPEKGTKYKTFGKQVSFFLYWIDKYMKDEKLQKIGGGWDGKYDVVNGKSVFRSYASTYLN